jgi:hypothetical protein
MDACHYNGFHALRWDYAALNAENAPCRAAKENAA